MILVGGPRRPRFPIGGCRWWCGWAPELARQLGGSWPGARGGLVLDGRQPVAGEGGAPELARQLGRSWPGARGGPVLDGWRPAAARGAPVLDGRQPVPVRLAAGSGVNRTDGGGRWSPLIRHGNCYFRKLFIK